MIRNKFAIAVAFGLCGQFITSSAQAASAENFITNLSGKWRGGGAIRVNEKGRKVKLRCSFKNVLNKGKRQLSLRGRCASSAGKGPFNGVVRYAKSGTRVTGRITGNGTGGRVSGSSASFNGTALTFTSTITDTKTGQNFLSRSVLSGTGSGFRMTISAEVKGRWRRVGTLRFKR